METETTTTPAQRVARAIMQAAKQIAADLPIEDAHDYMLRNNLRAVRAWSQDAQTVILAGDTIAIDRATDAVFNTEHEGTRWHTFVHDDALGATLRLECPCDTDH